MDSIISMSDPQVLNSAILAGLSLNLETSISGRFPPEAAAILPLFSKVVVRDIEFIAATPLHPSRFLVTAADSDSTKFYVVGDSSKESKESAAGSSVNIALVLRVLGSGDVAVVGPVGEESGAKSLIPALDETGIGKLLFRAKEASWTVTVRDPDGHGSTLLCVKKPYEVSDEILCWLADARPDILVVTGLKESDLKAAGALFHSKAKRRAVMPHLGLVRDGVARRRFINEILPQADLMQLNVQEASALLEKERFDDSAGDLEALLKMGPKTVIVTLGRNGAVAADKEVGVITQEFFRAEQIVDTSGAGDVHYAAIIYYHWLHGQPLAVAMKMAGWIASCKVGAIGPWEGIPDKERREEKLREFLAE